MPVTNVSDGGGHTQAQEINDALSILPYNVQFLIMSEHSHNCGFKYFMTQKLSQNNKKCKLDVKFQNYEIKPFPILLRVLPLLNAFLCI